MKRFELAINIIQVPIDFFLLLAAAVSAYQVRFLPFFLEFRPVLFDVSFAAYARIAAAVALFWIVLFALLGLYNTHPQRRFFSDVVHIFFGCSAGLSGVALYLVFTQQVFDSRFLVAVSWVFAIAYVVSGRLAMRFLKAAFYRFGFGTRQVVVIGASARARAIANVLRERKELGYTVLGVFETFSQLLASLPKTPIDEVLYAHDVPNTNDALGVIEWCTAHQVIFKYPADLFATYSSNVSVHPVGGIPIIEIRRTRLEGWGRVVKRLFDLAGSSLGVMVAAPIMAGAALAIFFETGFPIIYRNERVGLKGKKFFTLKFRSMYQKDCTGPQFGSAGQAAEAREAALIATHGNRVGPIYKIANDPRVTPVGRWLRRWSIDELPQFLNVLRGDMSIVGPRPHQPREVAQYGVHHKRVFFMKPGITGLAQIAGRSDLSFEEESALDVFYLEHWSLWLDCIILLKTPFAVLRRRRVL